MKSDALSVYLFRHLQVLFDTLGRLWKAPLASVMTILVLAIAMTLPMVLYKVADSLADVTSGWGGSPRISVFVPEGPEGEGGAKEVGIELLNNPFVEDVEYVSPAQGLSEFSEVPGITEAIEALPDNPLPGLLVVTPAAEVETAEIDSLVSRIEERTDVDSVVYDQKWLTRIDAIVGVLEQGVLILSALMAAGVLLVIGNTVRIGISSRSEEIEILDQVGGTHRFIRRPFLYLGVVQSLLGALLAWVASNLVLWLLSRPIAELARLYDSDFRIGWAGAGLGLLVVLLAVLLGLVAARITVDRHLRRLRPR